MFLPLFFRKILRQNSYPSLWKLTHICPVFKKNNRNDISNYRPISLLSVVSKVFERIIYKRMMEHLLEHNLLYKYQSGFLKGHSTEHQLLAIQNQIISNSRNGFDTRGIFLDIASAFDRVPHTLLLQKLKAYGINGNLLSLFGKYSESSPNGYINCSVPQGSILGPLMFLVYINDLPDMLQSSCFIYADDTSIFVPTLPNDQISQDALQNDLNSIGEWSVIWKLDFKPEKCIEVIFSKDNNFYPGAFLNNEEISRKSQHKHLGFVLDSKLSGSDHISYISEKVQKATNPLRSLKYKVTSKQLNTMYSSYILSLFDYCDILYCNATQANLTKLDSLQYQAGLICSGALHGSNTAKVLSILNWNTLYDRRKLHAQKLMYNIHASRVPIYISELFAPFKNIVRRNLRNAREYILPQQDILVKVQSLRSLTPGILLHLKFGNYLRYNHSNEN